MSNDEVGLQKVGQSAPNWVQAYQEEDKSLDNVKKYRQLTRLRLVQGMSPTSLKKEFGEGAVLMQPGRALVAKPEESFNFVPLFMFTEFIKWSDRKDDSTRAVLEKSFSERSEVAKRARAKEGRFEEYSVNGEDYVNRYVEHLCFPGMMYGGSHHGKFVTLSFEKGEFMQGMSFCTAISGRGAPIYLQVWRLQSAIHTDGKNDWWGFDYGTPEEPFVKEEEGPSFKKMYEELATQWADNALEIDRDDDVEDVETIEVENTDNM